MRSATEKQLAKRKAEGETFIRSTIRPSKPKQKESGSYCPIRRKTKVKKAKPIAKRGPGKAKREARNKKYYGGAEWKAKRQTVFARDGFQCVEVVEVPTAWVLDGDEMAIVARCPNRGEIVNGKQTGRGLVAEEKSYFHRDKPENIDRIVTRCKDCDRRLTPLERANHANGFNNRRGS